MTLTEKLQMVIRFGQDSYAMDRRTPVHLYWYRYDNRRQNAEALRDTRSLRERERQSERGLAALRKIVLK